MSWEQVRAQAREASRAARAKGANLAELIEYELIFKSWSEQVYHRARSRSVREGIVSVVGELDHGRSLDAFGNLAEEVSL